MFEPAPLGPAGDDGVIDMAFLSVIRRWALRDEVPIREIARRTGLSRNTVRKYLRSGAAEPKFNVPKRTSKLDAFADKLALWLKVEAGKSRKQRRTVRQLHAELAALGYSGSYQPVAKPCVQPHGSDLMLTASMLTWSPAATRMTTINAPSGAGMANSQAATGLRNARGVPAPVSSRMINPRL